MDENESACGSRAVRLAAIGLVAWLCVADAHGQSVSENFDRISGERSLSYTADGSRDPAQPVFTFDASLSVDPPSASITLAFVSGVDEAGRGAARFASCHDIAWTVDGQPLASAPASHRGRVIDGELIELVEQPVATAWVARIGNAQSVAYRVCRNQFLLSSSDIRAFATIAARLKSATPSPATAQSPVSDAAVRPEAKVEFKGMDWRPGKGSLFRP